MYKKILIATDGSELADKAIAQGLGLAKELGSEVIVLTVIKPWHPPGGITESMTASFEEHQTTYGELAKKLLTSIEKRAQKMNIPCKTISIISETAIARTIMKVADEHHSDLIVMASHGRRALERMLLGSETLTVLTFSKIPVLVCR
ncbi:MAG TPA: universal stress protein [Candidatus Paceibacterota bacterium]|nr:universal stress protein [Candidatus Paceibacterota bacterium]